MLLATAPVASVQTEEARLHDLARKGNASALQQLKALANKGNLEAAFQLSILYSASQGVPDDPDQSVMWGRKAAEGGHAEAQANLEDFGICELPLERRASKYSA